MLLLILQQSWRSIGSLLASPSRRGNPDIGHGMTAENCMRISSPCTLACGVEVRNRAQHIGSVQNGSFLPKAYGSNSTDNTYFAAQRIQIGPTLGYLEQQGSGSSLTLAPLRYCGTRKRPELGTLPTCFRRKMIEAGAALLRVSTGLCTSVACGGTQNC